MSNSDTTPDDISSEVEKETIELADDDDDVMLSTRVDEPSTSAPLLKASTTASDPGTEEEEDISDEVLPSREECQSLTEQFAEVTGTDTALAQFFLQDRQWNLEKSVNAYFESRKGGVKVLTDGEQPELVVTFDSKMVSALEGAQVTTVAPTRFKLLTWNIDGIEHANLKKRAKAIIKIIESERADIVFIQEMVAVVYSYMEERLPQYMFIAAGSEDYFTTMLLRRTSVYFDGHELIPFPGSCMGRNLLMVEAHIGACQLLLMTSHLESTAEFTEERKRQLSTGFEKMAAAPSHVNAIFAGDLNLRDKEVAEIGLPGRVVDVWESTGRRREAQYTWDLTRNTNKDLGGKFKPRCRFDRVYLKSGVDSPPACSSPTAGERGPDAATKPAPSVARPRYFGLVGLQKVSGTQSFPSDHWGVMTHYDIVSASSS